MVGAFLFLLPLVPYATFRAGETVPRSLFPATKSDPPPPPPFGCRVEAPARDGDAPASPFSARRIRETSRGWEWKSLETPGWKLLMTPSFVVRGDVPIDDLRTVGATLEEFLRMARAALGGDDSGLMFSARVFAGAREFRRYAARSGASNAESFYDPRSAELVVCLEGPPSPLWLQKTLAHEFAHEYMDRVWKRTDPLWFAEGVAEYFANFSLREGRAVAGAVDHRGVLLLRMDEPLPLKDFFKLGRDEMYGFRFAHHYAQAWSLVHYLFTREDGVVDLLLRGTVPPNVEELEKGWREHLERLE
ncbi:MAG TPA: DUF1570 domain-containing protein [Planctomycetota bacterium]|nr:DUF1570 domain-containing protein [Planctomycetota bacterium]